MLENSQVIGDYPEQPKALEPYLEDIKEFLLEPENFIYALSTDAVEQGKFSSIKEALEDFHLSVIAEFITAQKAKDRYRKDDSNDNLLGKHISMAQFGERIHDLLKAYAIRNLEA